MLITSVAHKNFLSQHHCYTGTYAAHTPNPDNFSFLSGFLKSTAYTTMNYERNLPDEELPELESFACADDIRLAIENMSDEVTYRIERSASYLLGGTEYKDPQELINEAVVRAMSGANSDSGRHWPKHIAFVAFLIETMKSIANASRESPLQRNTTHLDSLVDSDVDESNTDDALASLGYSRACVVTQAIDIEDAEDRINRAKTDVQKIDRYFETDDEVSMIIMGLKDGLKASDIRDVFELTIKQYETAHRRLRRGLDKLYPGRRNA